MQILAVFFGGGLGALSRYGVSCLIRNSVVGVPSYWATFTVNSLGSLLIGFCYGLTLKNGLSSPVKLFLMTGYLGAFTTFSAVSLEVMQLLKSKQIGLAIVYVLASHIVGGIAVWVGFWWKS